MTDRSDQPCVLWLACPALSVNLTPATFQSCQTSLPSSSWGRGTDRHTPDYCPGAGSNRTVDSIMTTVPSKPLTQLIGEGNAYGLGLWTGASPCEVAETML